MTILVTGASGTLGAAVCREALSRRNEVVAVSRDRSRQISQCPCGVVAETGDVRDVYRLVEICRKHSVRAIIHCAANKHVEVCEHQPGMACETNIGGVQNILETIGIMRMERAVFVSSDKAGDNTVYGMSKLIGERLVSEFATQRHLGLRSVRLGNLIGSGGSVTDIWKKALADNVPITLHKHEGNSANRFVMHTHEAATFILDVLTNSDYGTVLFRRMPVMNMDVLRQAIAPNHPLVVMPLAPQWMDQTLLSPEESQYTNEANDIFSIDRTRDTSGRTAWTYGTRGRQPLSLGATQEWLANMSLPRTPRELCT